jgi:hypothetical protein
MNQEDGSGNVRLNERLGVAAQVWQNLHNALERKASEAETLRLRVEWLEAGINAALSHYGSLPKHSTEIVEAMARELEMALRGD